MEEILKTIINRLFLNSQVYVNPLNEDHSKFEVLYSRLIATFNEVINYEYKIDLISNINKIEFNVEDSNVKVNFIFNVSSRENKYVDKNNENKIILTYYISSIEIKKLK